MLGDSAGGVLGGPAGGVLGDPLAGAPGGPAHDVPAAEAGPAFPFRLVPGPGSPSNGPAGRPAEAASPVSRLGTGPGVVAGPAYGDWTRPSRSGADERVGGPPVDERAAGPAVDEDRPSQPFARLRASAPPETTAIPDREIARRARPTAEVSTGEDLEALSTTGTIGGRAATRAVRQAAEDARLRARKERAARDDAGRRSPHRAALGLVAVAVVALTVLGVYSFRSPAALVAAVHRASPASSAPAGAAVPGVADLPPLDAGPLSAAPAEPTAAVRLPVTVLNATDVRGLAATVAGALKGGGWPTTPVGSYLEHDVATSTVYFTKDDEKQRQAAVQLVAQFPQLQGPVPRFFDVPGASAPGLVVVVTGNWRP